MVTCSKGFSQRRKESKGRKGLLIINHFENIKASLCALCFLCAFARKDALRLWCDPDEIVPRL